MAKAGDKKKVTVVRYGRQEEQELEMGEDGRWHFCPKDPPPAKTTPKPQDEFETSIDELVDSMFE